MRSFCVHYDVSVLVICFRAFDSHALMPAVHSAHRVGVNREGKISPKLLHHCCGPLATEGLNTVDTVDLSKIAKHGTANGFESAGRKDQNGGDEQ